MSDINNPLVSISLYLQAKGSVSMMLSLDKNDKQALLDEIDAGIDVAQNKKYLESY